MTTDHNEELELQIDTAGPGDILKQARERLGLTQEDVASRLRLRTSVIDDIENNIFDTSNQATFTRGYIRSFAKCVNLDEDQVLSYLSSIDNLSSDDQKMMSFSRRTKREAHDSRVMSLTWVIGILLLGVPAYMWWQSIQMENEGASVVAEQRTDSILSTPSLDGEEDAPAGLPSLIDTSDTEEDSPLSVTDEVLTSQNESEEDIASDDSVPADESSDAETNQALESTADATLANSTAETSATEDNTSNAADMMSITFNGDCWVDIRDASGKRLVTGIKKQGESMQLQGQEPFKLVLGAPDVVELRYQGEVVDLSRFGAGKVARFNLPQ